MYHFKKNKKLWTEGFTLIELVVTVAIFIVITGVVLYSYPKYGDRLSIGRVSREMSLLIRQAQVYGIAVKKTDIGGAITAPHYGVYFDTDKPKQFVFFSDRGLNPTGSDLNNHWYDEGTGCSQRLESECEELFALRGREYIKSIAVGNNPATACDTGTSCNLKVVILFARPDPDAVFYVNQVPIPELADFVAIKIGSERFPNETRTVRIWATGQIAVLNQ